MKHLYLLAPILAILAICGVYFLIKENDRPVPRHEPAVLTVQEPLWNADDYMRHLKARPFNGRELHRLLLKRTRQKQGVYLESLEPAMDTFALEIVNVFHAVMGDDYTPVITSGNDWPYHVKNSKHYQNKALDFRIKFLSREEKKTVVEMARERLKGKCRVLWEKGDAEHLHVEMLK